MFHSFFVKGCDVIQFSHGGNLYAINDDENGVHIFKFFHGDRPENYIFRGHENKVVGIKWLEDDTGFVTVGKDSKIAYWRLSDAVPKLDDNAIRKQFTSLSIDQEDVKSEQDTSMHR
jgi:WD40 repeat protein